MVKLLDQVDSAVAAEEDVVLSVNGVSKRFCRDLKRSLLYGVQDITTDLFDLRKEHRTLRPKEFWALQDVSFQLRRGEALGLVGKNGSGKSTLLRIIAGLIKPDIGSVNIKGRVAPLIALGAGFSPILTGRENIYANMSILGLSKQEIDDRFDEVVAFADINRDALNAPVQTYSSGMAARLGFACAIHTSPDVLLIDEVLAVGDVKFRVKCYRKLMKLRQQGISFILVSHNPHSILGMCNIGSYLDSGKLIFSGEPGEVMNRYEEDLFANEIAHQDGNLSLPEKPANSSYGLDIISLSIRNTQGKDLGYFLTGEPASFCIKYKAHWAIDDLIVNIMIREQFGENDMTLSLNNHFDNIQISTDSGEHSIYFDMPYCCLKPGFYIMKMSVSQGSIYNILDAVESFTFSVKSNVTMSQCMFYQPRSWKAI
jgi:lipopolysaccharide transport system ATP-binding protein